MQLIVLLCSSQEDVTTRRSSFLISHKGEGDVSNDVECTQEGMSHCTVDVGCRCQDSANNSYTCLRTLSDSENTLFCQFRSQPDFHELYDLKRDPHQLLNLGKEMSEREIEHYSARLRALEKCRGHKQCSKAGSKRNSTLFSTYHVPLK